MFELLQRHGSKEGTVMQDEDVLTEALKEFGEQYPSVLRPLIEERDEYMVWTLRRLAAK